MKSEQEIVDYIWEELAKSPKFVEAMNLSPSTLNPTIRKFIDLAREGAVMPEDISSIIEFQLSDLEKENKIIRIPEVWPDGATLFVAQFLEGDTLEEFRARPIGPTWLAAVIQRPVEAWQPTVGKKFWSVVKGTGTHDVNVLDIWQKQFIMQKGYRFAEFQSVDELDWTWEQFQARGDCWEGR